MDPRHERLAELLIHHSTRLQAGEHVLIEAFDIPESMVIAAVKAAKSVGRIPRHPANNRLQRALIEDATDAQVAPKPSTTASHGKMDAYLGLRGGNNANELAGLSGEDQKRWSTGYQTQCTSAACEPHPLVRVALASTWHGAVCLHEH